MSNKREFLNWYPSIEVTSMDDVTCYDPWDLFPGKNVLNRRDRDAVAQAALASKNPYLQKELGIFRAIIDAGGIVRRSEERRGAQQK